MLDRLRSLFRSEAFKPGTVTFPEIDTAQLARDLDLERRGRGRGAENQPPSQAGTADHVELEIVERITEYRRIGLQHYEDMLDCYAMRLSRAELVRQEIDDAADTARGNFRAEVANGLNRLTGPHRDVTLAYERLRDFQKRNDLERPLYRTGDWLALISICVALGAIETVMNGSLFMEVYDFGLAGGISVAILISVINVGGSSLLGGGMRYGNHRRWLWRLIGLGMGAFWLTFALLFNLMIAHFRDAMATAPEWSSAAREAISGLWQSPLGIESIEAWLLFVIGFLLATVAAWKAYRAFDPYPGYAIVWRKVHDARDAYQAAIDGMMSDLEVRRDQAKAELAEWREEVELRLSEAGDALLGRTALQSHLQTFLESCDIKANRLLAVYRGVNAGGKTSHGAAQKSATLAS